MNRTALLEVATKMLARVLLPCEGARWLEENGERYGLYRRYDNEPWHFELCATRPARQPHPGAAPLRRSC